MKINLMTIYAIKTLKNIAENESAIVTSTSISEKENIPHGVLMKVLRKLRVNDIISSHQGRGQLAGGYSLSTPVSKITLLSVVEIMEGPFRFGGINIPQDPGDSSTMSDCEEDREGSRYLSGVEMEYERILEVIKQEMSRYTLEELFRMKG